MGHELEKYYQGDQNWNNFVKVHAKKWEECTFQDALLLSLNNHLDIAIAVFGLHQKESMQWIETSIVALDGLTPVECTQNLTHLVRLKTMLMRI